MTDEDVRAALPAHDPGDAVRWPGRLQIDGLVRRPLALTLSDLLLLPHTELADDFTCVEGWTVPALRWWGVPLATVLAMAGILPEARFAQVSAHDFSVPLSLDTAHTAVLATHLGSEALPVQHGGPVRLVVPGGECFTSIKWLDRLELRREPAPNTGRDIALGRLAPRTPDPQG